MEKEYFEEGMTELQKGDRYQYQLTELDKEERMRYAIEHYIKHLETGQDIEQTVIRAFNAYLAIAKAVSFNPTSIGNKDAKYYWQMALDLYENYKNHSYSEAFIRDYVDKVKQKINSEVTPVLQKTKIFYGKKTENMRLGIEEQAKKNHTTAIEFFQKGLNIGEPPEELIKLMINSFKALGRDCDAIDYLVKYQSQITDTKWYKREYLILNKRLNRVDEVVEILKNVIIENKDREEMPELINQLVNYLFTRGEYERIQGLYENFVILDYKKHWYYITTKTILHALKRLRQKLSLGNIEEVPKLSKLIDDSLNKLVSLNINSDTENRFLLEGLILLPISGNKEQWLKFYFEHFEYDFDQATQCVLSLFAVDAFDLAKRLLFSLPSEVILRKEISHVVYNWLVETEGIKQANSFFISELNCNLEALSEVLSEVWGVEPNQFDSQKNSSPNDSISIEPDYNHAVQMNSTEDLKTLVIDGELDRAFALNCKLLKKNPEDDYLKKVQLNLIEAIQSFENSDKTPYNMGYRAVYILDDYNLGYTYLLQAGENDVSAEALMLLINTTITLGKLSEVPGYLEMLKKVDGLSIQYFEKAKHYIDYLIQKEDQLLSASNTLRECNNLLKRTPLDLTKKRMLLIDFGILFDRCGNHGSTLENYEKAFEMAPMDSKLAVSIVEYGLKHQEIYFVEQFLLNCRNNSYIIEIIDNLYETVEKYQMEMTIEFLKEVSESFSKGMTFLKGINRIRTVNSFDKNVIVSEIDTHRKQWISNHNVEGYYLWLKQLCSLIYANSNPLQYWYELTVIIREGMVRAGQRSQNLEIFIMPEHREMLVMAFNNITLHLLSTMQEKTISRIQTSNINLEKGHPSITQPKFIKLEELCKNYLYSTGYFSKENIGFVPSEDQLYVIVQLLYTNPVLMNRNSEDKMAFALENYTRRAVHNLVSEIDLSKRSSLSINAMRLNLDRLINHFSQHNENETGKLILGFMYFLKKQYGNAVNMINPHIRYASTKLSFAISLVFEHALDEALEIISTVEDSDYGKYKDKCIAATEIVEEFIKAAKEDETIDISGLEMIGSITKLPSIQVQKQFLEKYIQSGQIELGLKLFNCLVRMNKEDFYVRLNLYRLLIITEKYEESIPEILDGLSILHEKIKGGLKNLTSFKQVFYTIFWISEIDKIDRIADSCESENRYLGQLEKFDKLAIKEGNSELLDQIGKLRDSFAKIRIYLDELKTTLSKEDIKNLIKIILTMEFSNIQNLIKSDQGSIYLNKTMFDLLSEIYPTKFRAWGIEELLDPATTPISSAFSEYLFQDETMQRFIDSIGHKTLLDIVSPNFNTISINKKMRDAILNGQFNKLMDLASLFAFVMNPDIARHDLFSLSKSLGLKGDDQIQVAIIAHELSPSIWSGRLLGIHFLFNGEYELSERYFEVVDPLYLLDSNNKKNEIIPLMVNWYISKVLSQKSFLNTITEKYNLKLMFDIIRYTFKNFILDQRYKSVKEDFIQLIKEKKDDALMLLWYIMEQRYNNNYPMAFALSDIIKEQHLLVIDLSEDSNEQHQQLGDLIIKYLEDAQNEYQMGKLEAEVNDVLIDEISDVEEPHSLQDVNFERVNIEMSVMERVEDDYLANCKNEFLKLFQLVAGIVREKAIHGFDKLSKENKKTLSNWCKRLYYAIDSGNDTDFVKDLILIALYYANNILKISFHSGEEWVRLISKQFENNQEWKDLFSIYSTIQNAYTNLLLDYYELSLDDNYSSDSRSVAHQLIKSLPVDDLGLELGNSIFQLKNFVKQIKENVNKSSADLHFEASKPYYEKLKTDMPFASTINRIIENELNQMGITETTEDLTVEQNDYSSESITTEAAVEKAYTGQPVFISVPGSLQEKAEELKKALFQKNVNAFYYKQEIKTGVDFEERIHESILKAKVVVFLMSEEGLEHNLYNVNKEFEKTNLNGRENFVVWFDCKESSLLRINQYEFRTDLFRKVRRKGYKRLTPSGCDVDELTNDKMEYSKQLELFFQYTKSKDSVFASAIGQEDIINKVVEIVVNILNEVNNSN